MSHHINSMLLLNSVIHKAPLGIFIEELNIFLSFFPADVTLTTYLWDVNLPPDKLLSSCLFSLLHSYGLTFNNLPAIVFNLPSSAYTSTLPCPTFQTNHNFVYFILSMSERHLVMAVCILKLNPNKSWSISLELHPHIKFLWSLDRTLGLYSLTTNTTLG